MSTSEELPLFIIGAVMSATLLLVLFAPFVLRFRLRRFCRFTLAVDGTPREALDAFAADLRTVEVEVVDIEADATSGLLRARRAATTLTATVQAHSARTLTITLAVDATDLAALDSAPTTALTGTTLAWFALRLQHTMGRLKLAGAAAWSQSAGGEAPASRPVPWWTGHLVRLNPFF